MSNQPALVILAAGMGSRYGGLKQMDTMGPNGETVLDYSVFDAIRAGFSKIIFVIRKDFADGFKKSVGSRFAGKVDLAYAYQTLEDLPEGFTCPSEREKPWGTAHAVRAARYEIDRPFAVINADDFYGADAYKKAADFLTSTQPEDGKAHHCIVGYPLQNTLSDHGTVNRGLCQCKNGLLLSVEEIVNIARREHDQITGDQIDGTTIPISPTTIASMNLWGFPLSFLDDLEEKFVAFLAEKGSVPKSECYIPSVVDQLIREQKVDCHVLETTSTWFGVTYPDDKEHVVKSLQKLIDAGHYPAKLNS